MTEPRPIYPKHFLNDPVSRRSTGFILMPFEPRAAFNPIHDAIEAGIEGADLSPLRADDIFSTRSGMEKILRGIAEAEVVVADMTGRNANVFYETGIAHTIKDNVILLTQNINDIPFDFRHIDHIEYEPTKDGLEALTKELKLVITGLPAESPAEAPPVPSPVPPSLTPEAARSYLRDLVRRCEQEWIQQVVPRQDKVFEEDFHPRLLDSPDRIEQRNLIQESMNAIHPAFYDSWKSIEYLGFDIIEGERNDIWLDLFKALERAYNIPLPSPKYSTILGHGQLLVVRTWTLWGAYALERQNWKAVDTLLHQQLTLTKPGWHKSTRTALGSYKSVYAPDAAGLAQGGGDVATTIRFVLDQTEGLAEQRFIDFAELRGYVGLWLLACDLAEATARDDRKIDWPVWPYVPEADLERVFPLLDSDRDYAKGFVGAVAKTDPATLNALWQNGLRDRLMDSAGLGAERHIMVFRELPERFAE